MYSDVMSVGHAVVFGVHAVRPREICATQYVTTSEDAAEDFAAELSTQPGVLAAGVTRYVLGAFGQHSSTALYVKGIKQRVPYVSDDRRINAYGHGPGSTYHQCQC